MEKSLKRNPMKWLLKHNKDVKIKEMSSVVSKLLGSRLDVESEDILNEFLNPSLSQLEAPESLLNVELACKEVSKVIRNKGKIVVHGDYDVDGITSAVVVAKTLSKLGADFSVWLPHRILDGYGISNRFVTKVINEKPDLILTVDCGIAEAEKIKKITDAGINVVVTDHHNVPEEFPESALAVVNPKQKNEICSFKDFAGVGVAFKFCWCLCKQNEETLDCKLSTFLKELIPYVAIGTIADVMPLIGENRAIVSVGLEMIRNQDIDIGIADLIEIANLNIDKINSRDIGFMIAPRINSAGRIDDPSVAFRCFYCGDRTAASQLDMYNEKRKEASEKVFKDAERQIEDNPDDPIILVYREFWHEGVLGIVAGKIAEKYMKPAIVLSISSNIAKGSGRSVKGINLHEIVSSCSEHLERFGGHAQALGLSIKSENIEGFRKTLRNNFKNFKTASILETESEPTIEIDAIVEIEDIDDYLLADLKKLEPFGEGNPEPVFGCKNVKLSDMRTMGKSGIHLSVTALKNGKSCRIVCFNAGNFINLIEENINANFDIAFVPSYNFFNGRTSIQLMLKDIKIS
jgi:single-stranded-DNA-specific exonuclease